MNLLDAAIARHEQVERQREEEHQRIWGETVKSTQEAAARWAANTLNTSDETAELRTAANWEYVDDNWPEGHAQPQITVRCVDQGLDFQYFRERNATSVHDHFQVLVRIEHMNPRHAARLREAGNQFFADWEYVDVRDLAHLGELAAEGRLAYMLPDGEFITTEELIRRRKWLDKDSHNVTWTSAPTDDPRDQQADLYGPYWALVGPDADGAWSWTLIRCGDDGESGEDVATGKAAAEEGAKVDVIMHLKKILRGEER